MSHIFISYAHADKVHLDKLTAWLQANDFSADELWYDQHIEGGNNWRDEITTALDYAFVVLIIVTQTSSKSLYCTYEWAYALGQGIPILPLIFDTINVVDVPTPLTSKQFINCMSKIPSYLKHRIDGLSSTSPQFAAVNNLIYETIYDIHRRFFILGWIGDGLISLNHEFVEKLISDFANKAEVAYQTLQTFVVDKSFAFNGKQYRLCWTIMDLLKDMSGLPSKYDNYFQDHLFPQFDSDWLPAFEYFEGNKNWWDATRVYFERNLEDESVRMNVFAEMIRAFPLFHPHHANILIQNKIIAQRRRSSPS